jgi:uncharacterized glyoxalase superfamily protein PhnB
MTPAVDGCSSTCHLPTSDVIHQMTTSTTSYRFHAKDIDATVAEMSARGVQFIEPIREEDWGRVTSFELPGGGPILLYQSNYK